MELKEQVNDHEQRIRRLEESDIEQKIKLTNIEKSQAEIKLMITEGNNKLLDNLINNTKERQEVSFYNTKQFWAIVVAVVTAIIAFYFK